jgi:hypothetical protein
VRQEERASSAQRQGEILVRMQFETDFPQPEVDRPAQVFREMAEFYPGLPEVLTTGLPDIPETSKAAATISKRMTSHLQAEMKDPGTQRPAVAGRGVSQGAERVVLGAGQGKLSGGGSDWGGGGWDGGDWHDPENRAEPSHSTGGGGGWDRDGKPEPRGPIDESSGGGEHRGGDERIGERRIDGERGGKDVGVPTGGATLAGHNEGSKEHKNIKEDVVRDLKSEQRDVEAIEGTEPTAGDVGKQKGRANKGDPQAASRKRREAEAGDEGRAPRQGKAKKGKTSTGGVMATRSRQAPKKTPATQPNAPASSRKRKTGLRQAPSVELLDKKPAPGRRTTKRKEREAEDNDLEGQRARKYSAPARKKATKQKERGGGQGPRRLRKQAKTRHTRRGARKRRHEKEVVGSRRHAKPAHP